MALGWDTALAVAAIYENIPFIAAVPVKGQELRWPMPSQKRYRGILNKAHEIVTVCKGAYKPSVMQKRNEWMVDHSDLVLALWNGSNGGTKNCVDYVLKRDKVLVNLWDKFNA